MFSTVSATTSRYARTFVVGVYDDLRLPKGLGSAASSAGVFDAINQPGFGGTAGSVVEVFASNRRIFLFGLGKRGSANWLNAFAAVARRLAQQKVENARLLGERVDAESVGLCLGLLAWNYVAYKGSGSKPKELSSLTIELANDAQVSAFERGSALAKSMNVSRNLSMTPPNVATPAYMADFAKKMAKETGLACRVIEGKELDAERLTGLREVGKASENSPCLIRLEYTPKGGSKEKPLVLVGKTITYDTGGLSLKISGSMVGMKQDKDGGCGVLGAMHAIATVIKPSRPVVALLCAAENSVSSNAYRPDDVLEFRNGVTVEVTNTDAEGRLVLADGLCWACENENPAAIVDMATLTGGVVTALGAVYGGMFCDDDLLRGKLESISGKTGERVWRLPHHEEYREMMKSPIADIINSNPNRQAHPVQGAAFLSYFVTEGMPWAHLDIAGVHDAEKDRGPFVKGPVGFGVRLLAMLAEEL